ncbi:uracil-DNA glycosylase family protein [Bradyrhizobium retamae]|uniref:uracil-DNA glycosylase family protein n=1 Tax=Bradyrhizobium retamae TaxID=1300035 RepID=UPI0009E83EC3
MNKRLDQRRVAPEGLIRQPRLYLVGEAPGAEEAEQGRPFVGPAGCALRNSRAVSDVAEQRKPRYVHFQRDGQT